MNWIKSKYPGIRYREHESRKHGIQKDKYWVIRYNRDGKLKSEALGWSSEGWTEQKANETLAKIKTNIRTGEGPRSLSEQRQNAEDLRATEAAKKARAEVENVTFKNIWPKYYELAKATKKPGTAQSELLAMQKWVFPAIGKKSLVDICTLDLERIKKTMLDAGKAPRTVEYTLAMIRQVFNYAIDNKIMTAENPARRVKKIKYDNKRLRYLTRDEADTLLTALKARSIDLHDMALLSLHTGTRSGEIFNLDYQDIDFESGAIFLRDTKNSETRVVYMSGAVKAMFERRKVTAGIASGLVFPGRGGKKITSLSRTFERAIEGLGFNDGITDKRHRFTFHCLRHTAASWLVQAGTPLYTVQQLLGHKTSALTARYSHLAPANLKETAKFFDQFGTNTGTEARPLTGTKQS